MEVALNRLMGWEQKSFEIPARKSLDYLEGTVHRNMDTKGNSVEGLGKKRGEP